jgi:hypothetical protein
MDFRARSGESGALLGSLLLLGASFVLLVLGPSILARFQSSAEAMPAGNYITIAAASGVALGGGAAMIAVISRLVGDVELRPYAALAPVLAVFAGFVLWGLRAQLPLQGVAAEYVGVFALALSVAGGGLIGQPSAAARIVGWLLALFAPTTLLLMVWGGSGQALLGNAIASFPQPLKVYLMLLGAVAFTLAVLGEVARALRQRRAYAYGDAERTQDVTDDEPVLLRSAAASSTSPLDSGLPTRLPPASPRLAAYRSPRDSMRASLETADQLPAQYAARSASDASAPRARANESAQPRSSQDPYLLQSQAFQQPDSATSYTPKVSVWDFEDEPLKLPKKNYLVRALLLMILVVGGGGAALYYGVMLPNQQKEQAALELMNQRKAQIQAVQERELVEKQAAEAKTAAQRLEQFVNAPAPAEAEQAAPSTAGAAAIAPK